MTALVIGNKKPNNMYFLVIPLIPPRGKLALYLEPLEELYHRHISSGVCSGVVQLGKVLNCCVI